jgi:hypothetical protein
VPVPGGASAVICVSLPTLNRITGAEPNVTRVASAKPVPVIVTAVAPSSGPCAGVTAEMVGAGRYA